MRSSPYSERLPVAVPIGKKQIGDATMGATKVAIAADGNQVSAHFGRCESYVVATVEDGRVASQTKVPNPKHESGRLPALMQELGVACAIVGSIGARGDILDLDTRGEVEIRPDAG